MKKWIKYIIWMLTGGMYGWGMCVVSCSLIYNLGSVAVWIGSRMGVGESVLSQVGMALGQLKDAQVVSPWIFIISTGVLLGACLSCICAKVWRKHLLHRIGVCVLCVTGCILLATAALWFTEVNEIRVGALLRNLLPLLSALL